MKGCEEAKSLFQEAAKDRKKYLNKVQVERHGFIAEFATLDKQRRALQDDLDDSVMDDCEDGLTHAYEKMSAMPRNVFCNPKPRKTGPRSWRRAQFQNAVGNHLGCIWTYPYDQQFLFCNILGSWFFSEHMCVPIVPFFFDNSSLAYALGVEDTGLKSAFNGLCLLETIGAAFSDCSVIIVPNISVATTPIQWKLIVLNEAILDLPYDSYRTSYPDGELVLSKFAKSMAKYQNFQPKVQIARS